MNILVFPVENGKAGSWEMAMLTRRPILMKRLYLAEASVESGRKK